MSSLRACAVSLALATSALPAAAAEAQPVKKKPSLVILVTMQRCCAAEAWPAAESAAQKELASLGLRVERVPGVATGERERRIELGVLAERRQAICALRIVRPRTPRGGGVEIWIDDRVTGKTLYRKLPIAAGQGRDAAGMAGLRAAEALRASLIEVALPQGRRSRKALPKDLVPLTRVEARRARPDIGAWGLRIGTGGTFSPGGTGLNLSVDVSVGYHGFRQLALLVDGAVTVYGSGVEGGALRSTFNAAHLRALVGWSPVRLRPFRILVGAGVGVVIPWATGIGSPAVKATTDHTAVTWLGGTLRAGVDLGRRLTLWLGIDAGALLPEVRVLFGDVVVATFGRPLISAGLSLEVRLP